MVSSKHVKIFEGLKRLTGSELNYKVLRAKIHGVDPPLIPFPGVYQADLVYLEGYGKDILDDGRVNFLKCQKVASYVIELQVHPSNQTYQGVPYQLNPVPEIQSMIRGYPVLDEDLAYNMSLYCEPRFAPLVPEWQWDMSYPAFTDMYGLVDRGDVVLAGTQVALTLQLAHPKIGPYMMLHLDPMKRTIRMLIFMHAWLHGAVEDRRKVIRWLDFEHSKIPVFDTLEMRTFMLCTMAYGIAASHRELGTVSKVKMDIVVANIMAISLQFGEINLDKASDLPKTLPDVENYLFNKLQKPHSGLLDSFERFNTYGNEPNLPVFTSALFDLSKILAYNSLRGVALDGACVPIEKSRYLTTMKILQPILANFHEQICPSALTFDGLLKMLCEAYPRLGYIAEETRFEIFGDGEQEQDSMLDSFLPANMSREEAGLQPSSLVRSISDQIQCALLRGQLNLFKNEGQLPKHLAIVMDGNRRYARMHNFENVIMGYTLGARQLMQVFPWCFSIGITSLTLWAMSTDNFSRDPSEVEGLIKQMTVFFEDFLLLDASVPVMGVRVRVTGDLSILPERLRHAIAAVSSATEHNTQFNLQIAINYGGREEILSAVKLAMTQVSTYKNLTVDDISRNTYASIFNLPPVDAILRTSGEIRLSGFHLWESQNAEFVFVEKKWPELDEVGFFKAIIELAGRNRRNGK